MTGERKSVGSIAPHHQHRSEGFELPCKSCSTAEPPQTGGSSRRKKEHQPGPFRGFVEGFFERPRNFAVLSVARGS